MDKIKAKPLTGMSYDKHSVIQPAPKKTIIAVDKKGKSIDKPKKKKAKKKTNSAKSKVPTNKQGVPIWKLKKKKK